MNKVLIGWCTPQMGLGQTKRQIQQLRLDLQQQKQGPQWAIDAALQDMCP